MFCKKVILLITRLELFTCTMLLPHLNRSIRLLPWETPTRCCLRHTWKTTRQIGVNHCDIMKFPRAPLRVMSLIYYLTERLLHNNILSQFLSITQHRIVTFHFPRAHSLRFTDVHFISRCRWNYVG